MEINTNVASLDPNKYYYPTFEEAHNFAKKLLKEDGLSAEVGMDRNQPLDQRYTVKFNVAAYLLAHPSGRR